MRLGGDGGHRLGGSGDGDHEETFNCDSLPLNCDEPLENPFVIGAGAVGLLLCGVLAACSIAAVPPLFYGIRYNYFWKWADVEHVYTPGRYFVGPWNHMIIFPSDVQRVEFTNEKRLQRDGNRFPALHTRTKEGLALHLQVSLQYRLKKDKVGALYNEFNIKYQDLFFSIIRDTLIQVASDYEAPDLWVERKKVGEVMQAALDHALGETYAECWGLQLLDIELPESFDNAIVKTQVQKQNKTTMTYAQQAVQVHARTGVIESEYDKQVTIKKATGTANYSKLTKMARANATSNTLRVESEVVANITSRLKLKSDEIVQYQQCVAVKLMENSTLYFGFEPSSQLLLDAGTPARVAEVKPSAPVERRLTGDVEGEALTAVQGRPEL